jgi:hypothetical protein
VRTYRPPTDCADKLRALVLEIVPSEDGKNGEQSASKSDLGRDVCTLDNRPRMFGNMSWVWGVEAGHAIPPRTGTISAGKEESLKPLTYKQPRRKKVPAKSGRTVRGLMRVPVPHLIGLTTFSGSLSVLVPASRHYEKCLDSAVRSAAPARDGQSFARSSALLETERV